MKRREHIELFGRLRTQLPEYQPFLGENGKDGSEKGRELLFFSLPPPPPNISSPLAP